MKSDQQREIWTIGHSTHTLDEFIAMLKSFQVEVVADIRSLPGSRKFPQFNKEALELTLPKHSIRYIHIKKLGGRRKVNPDSKNTSWRHSAFRGYADFMETETFIEGIEELEQMASAQRTAYMCSEAVWWRCHRSMVSDYLKAKGWEVLHIMSVGKAKEHPYTEPARIISGKLTYEAESNENEITRISNRKLINKNLKFKTMKARLNYSKVEPDALKAMLGLEEYAANSGLENSLYEIVKIRASQINGCAYCLDMHTKDARKAGETEQRLYALSAWRETPFYSKRERAALEWTEALTLIVGNDVNDSLYEDTRKYFSEKELVALTMAIIAINGWNRLAISFRTIPGSYEPKPVE